MSVENATINGMKTFIEYAKIHLISLEQDMEVDIPEESDFHYLSGQIAATRHLLSVAEDMI